MTNPPQNPMAQMQAFLRDIHQRMAALEASAAQGQIAEVLEKKLQFPEQFSPGVVAYPDRYPFPMVLSEEVRTADGSAFGISNAIARALVNVDVDNPTFLHSVSFSLYKTAQGEATIGLLNTYLPLSSMGHPFVRLDDAGAVLIDRYIGRDFRWRIKTTSDDRLWQVGYHSSAMCDKPEGYQLPVVYELRRNDVLSIEAEPIAAVVDEDEWALFVNLHIYKMLLKR